MFCENLNVLFKCISEKERLLVYGDLGRLPHIVVHYLSNNYANLTIFFISMNYSIPIPNHANFRQIHYKDIFEARCDWLFIVEPQARSFVKERYPGISCVVILTSHAILEVDSDIDMVIYFHLETFDRAARLRQVMEKQEGSEESENVQEVVKRISHPSVVTIGPGRTCDIPLNPSRSAPFPEKNHFVVVDLTSVTLTTSIFLYFWDAIDYMAANLNSIERWCVCFATHGKTTYESFVQECIDRLHCFEKFRGYLKKVLPILPFYRSGTLDLSYDVPTSRFVRHQYVAPDSIVAVLKAAITHDTQQLAGGVLSIIK